MTNLNIPAPDFEEIVGQLAVIKFLTMQKLALETELEDEESKIVNLVTSDVRFFTNGKAPSMAFIQKAYLFRGVDGELLERRKKLAEVTGELRYAELNYKLSLEMLGAWRTNEAS